MKRPFSFLAILALGTTLLQAAPQLYDITLSNAERYTQCKITYETDSVVKFRGTDKNGKVVTKEVKASSVLVRKEVKPLVSKADPKPAEPKKADKPDTKDEAPAETDDSEEPATEEEPAATTDEATEDTEQPEEEAADKAGAETAALAGGSSREKTYDAVVAKLAALEKMKEGIKEPSRTITSRFNSTKNSVAKNLQKIEAMCAEVDALQGEVDSLTGMGFAFEIVSEHDRAKYAIEGKAAYDAMVMDMNQKKSSRKIGGLDKFEILRESFQGIPEYKQAYEWYIKTLKDLNKKWDKMIAKEEAARKKYNSDKKAEADENDKKAYEKLKDQLEDEGEHIANVWYTPATRNLYMLRAAKNKVEDALRRNERAKKNEDIGTVTTLISNFWQTMDRACDLMVKGDLDEAKQLLEDDESFHKLKRLHNTLLPEEYKKPLLNQREALISEIKDRINKRRTTQRSLDSKRAALERLAQTTLTQLETLETMLQDEIDNQQQEAAEESEGEGDEATEETEESTEE